MKADSQQLMDFLGSIKTQFVIPVYQRNYDWKLEHCKQLIQDILQCGRDEGNTHFIGSIVYIKDGIYETTKKIKEFTIIDGQQRLTSITLILIALKNFVSEMGLVDEEEDITESYLINKQFEEKLKLRPNKNDDKALRSILNNTQNDYSEYSNLIENYQYFESQIQKENYKDILHGLHKLFFVEISLEREKDDPQKIFESLNSTGLDLSQADLIRNYILMGLKREDQERLYESYWQYIEKDSTDIQQNENRVSDYIRDFLTIKNVKIPNKGKVYKEFKSSYPFENIEALEITLKDLKKYVKYYKKLINPNLETNKDIKKEVANIKKLDINVSYPFLLQVYDDYESDIINAQTFIDVLKLIQSFVWRRSIVDLPTNALNKIFLTLYKDIEKGEYYDSLSISLLKRKGKQRFPLDAEVKEVLREKDIYSLHSRNRTYLLEQLENFENTEPVIIEGNSKITVEHIFPQNPDQKWKEDLDESEFEKFSGIYLHTIANLTLSGNNGSLGNKRFLEKRDLKDKGYKGSRLWLNKYLGSIDNWGSKEFEERFEILFSRFNKIWPFPSAVAIEKKESDSSEINIFDVDDPTYMHIEYVIFLDQKKDFESMIEMYMYVIKSLYELDAEKMLSREMARKLQISKSTEILRKARPLGNNYYIEINLSGKEIFQRLRYALDILDLHEDLIVKLRM